MTLPCLLYADSSLFNISVSGFWVILELAGLVSSPEEGFIDALISLNNTSKRTDLYSRAGGSLRIMKPINPQGKLRNAGLKNEEPR